MRNISIPLWLIITLVGLSQLSESAYSPVLPDIAQYLEISASLAEHTLTIFLIGFACGTLFWGTISDKYGRKPCVIMGLIIFIVGCFGCYIANNIEIMMISRFIQAFGCSIGSVLGQAICRDALNERDLGRAYASIGTALSIFPSIGPIVGGIIVYYFSWADIFLSLALFGIYLIISVIVKLPETHHQISRTRISLLSVTKMLLTDKNVMGYSAIIGLCNGISFSYFSEGSFFIIKLLNIPHQVFAASFIGLSIAGVIGGIVSKKLYDKYKAYTIIRYGILITISATCINAIIILLHYKFYSLSNITLAILTIVAQMIIRFASVMIISNILAIALLQYKQCIGTAASVFGFVYYFTTSCFIFGMGILHNGTLLPMPLYFAILSILILLIDKYIISYSVTK